MSHARTQCILAFVLGLIGEPALAQGSASLRGALEAPEPPSEPGRFDVEVGVFGGIFLPSSEHELYDSTQSFHSPYQVVGPKVGLLRLGFYPWPFLGIEGEGGYSPQENERGERFGLFDARGHVVVQLPGRVTPFLLAGGGLLGAEGESGSDVDEALHWGAGVKFYPTPWLNLRVDGRHVISSRLGPDTGNTNHFELTAGVSIVVFREPEAPANLASNPPQPEVAVAPEGSTGPSEANPAVLEPVVMERTLFVETMDPVEFPFDSIQVSRSFIPILREVVAVMKNRPELDVIIVGHADEIGTKDYNQRLSERRAGAVAAFLVGEGLESQRIRVRGEGERLPVAPNKTPEGRARNRRTEVTVVERREHPDSKVLEAKREDEEAEAP